MGNFEGLKSAITSASEKCKEAIDDIYVGAGIDMRALTDEEKAYVKYIEEAVIHLRAALGRIDIIQRM